MYLIFKSQFVNKKLNHFFIIILLLSFIGVSLITWFTIKSKQQEIYKHIELILQGQMEFFQLHYAKTKQNLELISNIYAENKTIQRLFQKAYIAVQKEGGKQGGEKAQIIRNKLYKLLADTWKRQASQYDVRQLHLHLNYSEVISFLRVHQPEKFGDVLTEARPMLVEANKMKQTLSGFETGRIYSGVRGISPIFSNRPGITEKQHIGTVEIGMSFLPIIKVMERAITEGGHLHDIHAMVLLDQNYLESRLWPDYLQKHFANNQPIIGNFIESTSTPLLARHSLNLPNFAQAVQKHHIHIFKNVPSPIALISIPIDEYNTQHNHNKKSDIGHIVIWFDISYGLEAMQRFTWITIGIAIAVIVMIVLFTYFSLRYIDRFINQIISLNKQLDESLLLASIKQEEAEFANKSKSAFLANMSHELRTPMHGILSFVNLGINKPHRLTPDKTLKYFGYIKTSADRLLTLLNDLLDLAKLESGKMVMNFQQSQLKKITESCLLEQKARLQERSIKIVFSPESINGKGMFDESRVGQVITNLLSNAIKFSPDGENIEFSISQTSIDDKHSKTTSPAYLFSIKDNGQGIPEGEFELVFNQFEQSSTTEIGTTNGTGLGLPICKEIIELHHGKIWAENSQQGGAVFSFIIPIAQV